MPRHPHKSWKLEEWPAAERNAWTAALTKGDTLREGGAASRWKQSTATTVSRSYGHWLKWIAEAGLLDANAGPAQAVSPESVSHYVTHLKDRVSSSTAASRILHIYMAVNVMLPKVKWEWLRDLWERLERRAVPSRDKNARLVDAADLLSCGLQAMADADEGVGRCLYERELLYRDAFLVALLITRPLRIANFARIELGRHLVLRGKTCRLVFRAEETKTYQPIDVPFPEALMPNLERYLELYRPIFLRNPKQDPEHAQRLWLSNWGKGLCDDMVYLRIMKLTKERIGCAINPHAFRHAAATSIAFADPEHVQITKSILGHGSLASSERYYNLAQAFEAARRWDAHVQRLRDGHRDEFIGEE